MLDAKKFKLENKCINNINKHLVFTININYEIEVFIISRFVHVFLMKDFKFVRVCSDSVLQIKVNILSVFLIFKVLQ